MFDWQAFTVIIALSIFILLSDYGKKWPIHTTKVEWWIKLKKKLF